MTLRCTALHRVMRDSGITWKQQAPFSRCLPWRPGAGRVAAGMVALKTVDWLGDDREPLSLLSCLREFSLELLSVATADVPDCDVSPMASGFRVFTHGG